MSDLPAELWTQVFDLAADEDVIFQLGLPTIMAESAWFKNFFGEWTLRSLQDALDLVQRRSYATKKAIVRTCKKWRSLGSEFLYRCLFFNDPARLLALCDIFDSSSAAATTSTASLGWWTRRIHLTRYYANSTRGTTPESLQDALISIIRHCPNLEIFIIDWPMAGSTFGPIADALATFTSKSLRTLHINVPSSALPKVIWALDSLPRVFAAHIELEVATPDDELSASDDTHLGAAGDITLRLPALHQLTLRGHIQEFLEQATGWTLPSLRHLSIDCGTRRTDLPDTLSFLAAHGAPLLFLDLHSIPAMPLPRILVACPTLTTLAFNADWRVIVPDDDDAEADTPPLAHECLTSVGLHGLMYAFDVGYAAAHAQTDPLPALIVTSANDRNITALCDRARFPALRRIRALSRSLLKDLDRANGPGPEGGMERWERWWEACRRVGVRLEDCTGGLLGELPQDEPESESSDEDEEEEEDEDGEFQISIPPLAPQGGAGSNIDELRQLLEECRAMDEGRDDNYMYASAGIAGFSNIPPVASGSESSPAGSESES
ncbi:hypothetical protein B0H17DRAFT_982851 [Mycena rosella]|uniref:F-box domain-containing protein n=1 Tax=Mycena rosella TaxID=1033263 RepID=A0AAD7GE95_MYCRO|nr:hypothetical protein B0H17DRAFT_982851 [Mycena rosella]